MNDYREFIVECMPSDNGLWWPDPMYVDPSRPNTEEIVRCRDCIYQEPEREPNRPQYKGALWCDYLSEGIGFPVWPDCFCCWGERKADE